MSLRNSLVPSSEISKKYRNPTYAQRVWDGIRSRAEFDQERSKYAKDFNVWFDLWHKDPAVAMEVIDNFDPNLSQQGFFAALLSGRTNQRDIAIQRGFDLQLLYEDFQERYGKWKHNAKEFIRNHEAIPSFSTLDLAKFFGPRPCMKPRKESIFECGLPPDWRTTEEKIEDTYLVVAVEKSKRRRDVSNRLRRLQDQYASKTTRMNDVAEICEKGTDSLYPSQQRQEACALAARYGEEIRAMRRELEPLGEEIKILNGDIDGLKQKIGMMEE